MHLPLPVELRKSRLKVTATIEAATGQGDRPARELALAALKRLRLRGTFRKITDPVAWQRDIRKDRPLPGREE